ncbi:MAG: hypothetical protein CO028_00015 [Candidatus Levybacteria bacterium CG_4_9_14_0_2_um_filter_35_21]|nr:MAG: hypothetical protein CO028_00015 [Candidatus Levybacteria bacterium CG_4_9_14_0_2_um_filter_35_21]
MLETTSKSASPKIVRIIVNNAIYKIIALFDEIIIYLLYSYKIQIDSPDFYPIEFINMRRTKKVVAGLHGKKRHLDLIIALLTIPVLLTVIISNLMNFQKNSKNSPTPTPAQTREIIIQTAPTGAQAVTQMAKDPVTPIVNCKKLVGPISISFPGEGQTVSDNPICIIIKYDDPNYCSAVWSYRINNNSWSEYSSSSVCLYNLPKGAVKFDLRAQSTVSQNQVNISRSFNYDGLSDSPVATSSAR